jgi:hypothetical protein
MNCRHTDELIRGGRLERLSPAERRELEAHLADCPRCASLVRPEPAGESLEPPHDLLGSILAETSGPACGRAEELLAARLDGELEELDASLVDAHADDCAGCDALRGALHRLATDLPAMRRLEPDAAFAGAVFAATSRSARPRRALVAARVRRLWKQVVQRPRFAWEAAYVGAMTFWLVLSSPLVKLPDTPVGAEGFLPDLSRARSAMQALRGPVSSFTRRVQRSTHEGWSSASEQVRQDLHRRTTDLHVAIDSIQVERGGQAFVSFTLDAREAVQRLIQSDSNDNETNRSEP